MVFDYYFFFTIVVSALVVPIYAVIAAARGVHVGQFLEALRDENNGRFQEAIMGYEKELRWLKKISPDSRLRDKIVEKIKVLRTVIEYKNNMQFMEARKECPIPIDDGPWGIHLLIDPPEKSKKGCSCQIAGLHWFVGSFRNPFVDIPSFGPLHPFPI